MIFSENAANTKHTSSGQGPKALNFPQAASELARECLFEADLKGD
jgi:hypothetical protein